MKKEGYRFYIPKINTYSGENEFYMDRCRPPIMEEPHWHPQIEINVMHNCDATYKFRDQTFIVKRNQMAVFWGAVPHQVTDVNIYENDYNMTWIYVSLEKFMTWNLPQHIINVLIQGKIIVNPQYEMDSNIFTQWLNDFRKNDDALHQQMYQEVELRMCRLSLMGINEQISTGYKRSMSSIRHIEAMISYIAQNYANEISVEDIASAAGLHPNYAMNLFRELIGTTLNVYLNRHRLAHAQTALLNTNQKISSIALDCGFKSLSRFYDVFSKTFQYSPGAYRRLHKLRTSS